MGLIAARITGLGIGASKQHLLQSLEVGSPELERIADSFSRMLPKSGKGLNIYSFQEALPVTGVSFAGKVVEDYSSSIGDAFEGKATIHADHMGMCAFSSKDNPDYDLVASVLRRWTKSASKSKSTSLAAPAALLSPVSSDKYTLKKAKEGGLVGPQSVSLSKAASFSSLFLVPQLPVRNFKGREDELAQIKELFAQQEDSSYYQKVVVLHGLGGVAKDEQTIKFQFRSLAQNIVDWAAKLRQTTTNFSRISYDLGLARFVSPTTGEVVVPKGEEDMLVDAIKHFLEQPDNAGWLLVFDAVDDLEGVNLTQFLPQSHHGDILISSRRRQASQLGLSVLVGCLRDQDACAILHQAGGFQESQEHMDDCGTIAKLLGNLPLALSQAASYIATTQTLPSDYIRLYHEQKKEVLRQKPVKSLWQYEETVFTTWEMSFAAISRDFPAAASLLVMSSFYDPQGIPYIIFDSAKQYDTDRARTWAILGPERVSKFHSVIRKTLLFKQEDPARSSEPITWLHNLMQDHVTFRKAISVLLDYSLVVEDSSQTNFSMHALVQAWCQFREYPLYYQRGFDAILSLGRTIDVDFGEPESWPLHRLTFPHVCSIAKVCVSKDLGAVFKNRADFSFPYAVERIGEFLSYTYQGKESLELHQYNYRCLSAKCKPYNSMVLATQAKIATAMEIEGMCNKAEDIWTRIIEAAEKHLGSRHSDTLTYMGNLGANLIRQERKREANDILRKVAWQRKEKYGLESAIPNFINLAVSYLDLEELDDAWKAIQLAKDGELMSNSKDLTNMFHIMGWIGKILDAKGQRKEAMTTLLSAAELAESKYGFAHPLTLQWYSNWVLFLSEEPGSLDESEIKDMIDIVDRMIKAWSDTFDSLQRQLAELQISTGGFLYIIAVLESERTNEPSFKIDKALADALVNLGMINWDEGLVTAGMSAWERSLSIFQSMEKSTTIRIDIVHVMNNIAISLRDSGRLDEAEAIFKQVIEEEIRLDGPRSSLLAQNNLASVYVLQNRYAEALGLFTATAESLTREFSANNHQALLTKHNLACLLEQLGRPNDAIALLEQVFQGKSTILSLRDPATLKTAITLGRMYRANGSNDDAVKLASTVRPYLDYA
ncbi:hypothetical protein OIDMADRAFT_33599 [Oidiodendron maius Zn]|uniref:NB-ARC domain-containing protein n=1 Tax=Oidiodendron maius (strain Zn) TaxID=913774 RepID=A0A0C3GYH8_OIDMZ|nr:hypothetical protein OIDMADRAFT_33599 [Oidiodendron maius Zn]